MKAIIMDLHGGPDILRYGDLSDPVAGRGKSFSVRARATRMALILHSITQITGD